MRTNFVAIPIEWLTADYADITDNSCSVEIEEPGADLKGVKRVKGGEDAQPVGSVNPPNPRLSPSLIAGEG
jgi:hypothetical protein